MCIFCVICVFFLLALNSLNFSEQCHNLIHSTYKTSCKYANGVEDMFQDIANQLVQTNRSRIELQTMDKHGFKITPPEENGEEQCLC